MNWSREYNWFLRLFKRKPKKEYTRSVTCCICGKSTLKTSNNVTCSKKECKLARQRELYQARKLVSAVQADDKGEGSTSFPSPAGE